MAPTTTTTTTTTTQSINAMNDAQDKTTTTDPNVALSECLFSQYALTVAGVAAGTGYALYKKPRNGIGIMLVAGAAGTLGDIVYGFAYACRPQVKDWYNQQPPAPSAK